MQQHFDKYLVGHDNICIEHIILVAHNGKVFDISFLMQQLSVNGMVDAFLQDKRFGLELNTLQLAHKSIQQNWTAGVPVAYNLSALHQYVTSHPPTVSHHAMADVKATITMLFYHIFWLNRGKFFFSFGRPEELQTVVVWMTLIVVLMLTPKEQTPILGTQQKTMTMSLQLATSGRKTLNIVNHARFRPNYLRSTLHCLAVADNSKLGFNAAQLM
jgi:hypothetical protein